MTTFSLLITPPLIIHTHISPRARQLGSLGELGHGFMSHARQHKGALAKRRRLLQTYGASARTPNCASLPLAHSEHAFFSLYRERAWLLKKDKCHVSFHNIAVVMTVGCANV